MAIIECGEFAQVANERADAIGYYRPFSQTQVADFIANGGTDWQNEIYRTANGQEVQLDYSGGSGAVTYMISGNLFDQDGIIINSYFKRYSLRSSIDAKLSDKL